MKALESKKYCASDRLFPFTLRCLTALLSHNHTLYLVSARHDKKNTLSQISMLGLKPFFTSIYAGNMHKNGRVAKRIAILPLLAGRNDPFAVVGDTQDDIEAARGLGGISIAVLTGIRNKKLLSLYRPKYIIRDIRHVLSIVS
jgi:phosphoglycolate phosphatase-like HAD superfamily hydrolase